MVLEIIGGFVVLVLLALVVGYVVSLYNQLVRLRKRVDQAAQNIDVLLKQRQDELTKLIDAAQEFMDQEEEVLTRLTEAREQADRASTPTEQANADQSVRDALAGFRARFEDYPELRSQENMMQFQERISDIENQIADRREFYNEAVTQYNTRIEQFPYVIMAKQFGFEDRELFTASEEETADVDVGAAFSGPGAASGSGS
ncbi:LemA family protein [Halobacteriales archaeon QH_10_70_21]|nr:MAG: LemA family protein [Halobacteriales archaeon QH_10_70_21]